MQYRYLTSSWQGLLQQVVALVGKGYHNYSIIKPKFRASISHWQKIDKIMLEIFNLEKSNRNSRYQNKKKMNANFQYLRYQDVAVILKTDGEINESLKNQKFSNILNEPIIFHFNTLSFKIGKSFKPDEFTVYLERETYRNIKVKLFEMITHKKMNELIYHFNILNNIPSYAGFLNQKWRLLNEIKKECKRHYITFDKSAFFYGTRRKIYKVWADEKNYQTNCIDETAIDIKPVKEYYERKESTHIIDNLDEFKKTIYRSIKTGYHEYYIVNPPKNKDISKSRWERIDDKIITKFSANKQLFDEHKSHSKKVANFRYYRYKDTAIILKTRGKLPAGFTDARFVSISKKAIKLQIEPKQILIIKIIQNSVSITTK